MSNTPKMGLVLLLCLFAIGASAMVLSTRPPEVDDSQTEAVAMAHLPEADPLPEEVKSVFSETTLLPTPAQVRPWLAIKTPEQN